MKSTNRIDSITFKLLKGETVHMGLKRKLQTTYK